MTLLKVNSKSAQHEEAQTLKGQQRADAVAARWTGIRSKTGPTTNKNHKAPAKKTAIKEAKAPAKAAPKKAAKKPAAKKESPKK